MVESFPGVLGTVICKAFDFTIGRAGLSERWSRDLNLDVETALWTGPDRPHYMEGAAPLTIKLVVERKNRRLVGAQVVGPGDAAKRLDVAVTAIGIGFAGIISFFSLPALLSGALEPWYQIDPQDSWMLAAAEHGIPIVADEVICGFGRTGQWFGHQTLGIEPDVVIMAKGLSSGYQPIGAVAVADHLIEEFL